MKLRSVLELNQIVGKRVFVRADFDVPLKKLDDVWIVEDYRRLAANLKTINYLINQGAKIVLAGQIDRPEGKVEPDKSTRAIFEYYRQQLPKVTWVSDCLGAAVEEKVKSLEPGGVLVLENLRFHPEEERKDWDFARALTGFADFYVNENFSNCHRDHTSMSLLPTLVPAYAGFNLIKEIEVLSPVLEMPRPPLVVVIGGAKVETKLPVIKNFLSRAGKILVGGLPGCHGELLEKLGPKVLFACGDPDLSFNVAKSWALELLKARTIIWNGPMGDTSRGQFTGTELIARAIGEATDLGAQSLVGGGDTEDYLKSVGLDRQMSFISTGGGAMLDFLAGIDLPALRPLIV